MQTMKNPNLDPIELTHRRKLTDVRPILRQLRPRRNRIRSQPKIDQNTLQLETQKSIEMRGKGWFF